MAVQKSKKNKKKNLNKNNQNNSQKGNKNSKNNSRKNYSHQNKNKSSVSSKNHQIKTTAKKNNYPQTNNKNHHHNSNNLKKTNQSLPKEKELEIKEILDEKTELITLIPNIKEEEPTNEIKESSKNVANVIEEITENKDETTDKIKENIIKNIEKTTENIPTKEKKDTFNLSKNKIIPFIIFLIITIFFIIYITIPKIKLSGNNSIEIPYQNNFTDPGYHATKLGKDITNKIQINSNLIEHKVGEYQIIYQTKYLFLTIKKVRNIHIIDNTKPIINIDNPVKICPHEDLSHIKYEAIDEYDGLLNNKVKLLEHDNILDLSVEDNSHNKTNVSIPLLRIDDELPEINLKNGEVIYLNEGTPYQEPGYTANDNCDGDLTKQVSISGTVEKNPGTYYLTYTVKDSSNNETKITRTIIVSKKTLPNSGYINNGSIYLTFDDGPNENTTRYILDILKEENIKATFFVTGSGPDYLIQRIYNEGHTLALHTASHDYSYVYSSVDNYFSDLSRVSERVKNLTGYESKIIRFPGGSSNTVSRNYRYGIMTELTNQVLNRGYRYYDWNIDSDDAGHAYTSEEVYYNVINNLSPYRANMILMHDTKYQTKNALRDIIHYAKNNGYTFKKIEMDTYMIRHKVNN